MAIVLKKDAPTDIYHKDMPKDCWFCGKGIWSHGDDYVVMWMGHGHDPIEFNNIYLHPDCAMHLSTRLIRDAVHGGTHLEREARK